MYGKCIAANYQNVSKDMCVKEFMALKDCYLVNLLLHIGRIILIHGLESGGKESIAVCKTLWPSRISSIVQALGRQYISPEL